MITSPRQPTSPADASLFVPDGPDRWVATEWSRGPWDPRHCHGGPVGALLARAVELADDGIDAGTGHAAGPADRSAWQIARLTVELTRPVPVGRPLELHTTIERPGRRVGLIAARLLDEGTEVARVRSLRIRRDPDAVASEVLGAAEAADPHTGRFPEPPDRSRPERPSLPGDDDTISFARQACEHRFAAGGWVEPGPVAVWIRLLLGVVPDEAPSPTQRVAAAADFGNGVSSVLPWDRYLFINPDLTVHLAREAQGDWIGLLAHTRIGSEGAGLAESALHDIHGPIGRSLQSLYVASRD